MTTDSETTEQYLTFVRSRFLISVLVFVSRDFELGRVSVQFANGFAVTIPFLCFVRVLQNVQLRIAAVARERSLVGHASGHFRLFTFLLF